MKRYNGLTYLVSYQKGRAGDKCQDKMLQTLNNFWLWQLHILLSVLITLNKLPILILRLQLFFKVSTSKFYLAYKKILVKKIYISLK